MWSIIADVILGLLVLQAILFIFLDKGSPGTKVSWLLIITILPLLGIILYFMFGIHYRHRWYFLRRHRRMAEYVAENQEKLYGLLSDLDDLDKVKPEFRPLARLMKRTTKGYVYGGNDVEIITDGHRKLDLLKRDLRAAKKSIHVEYYHFGNDKTSREIKEILMQKAGEGVDVRFLYENVANFPIASIFYDSMTKAGVEIVRFTGPLYHLVNFVTRLNYRNHRKIVVIDGAIAYTGGMNINEHYFFKWRDTHIRFTGPTVKALQFLFVSSWIDGGGMLKGEPEEYFTEPAVEDSGPGLRDQILQVVADEPDSQWESIRMSYDWLLHNVQRYVWFQTPYFVPPDSLLEAMKSAALRGVDVRLMLPEVPDNITTRWINKSYYEELMEAGVKIFLRNEFIHSKTFVADDYLSCIGSANMDNRSMDLNYEVNTLFYSENAAAENKAIFEKDLGTCRELTVEEWEGRSWFSRFMEKFSRLFAAIL